MSPFGGSQWNKVMCQGGRGALVCAQYRWFASQLSISGATPHNNNHLWDFHLPTSLSPRAAHPIFLFHSISWSPISWFFFIFHFNTTGVTVLLEGSCNRPTSRLRAAWATLADGQKETKHIAKNVMCGNWTDELQIMKYTELISTWCSQVSFGNLLSNRVLFGFDVCRHFV